jgi:hypothetical protein
MWSCTYIPNIPYMYNSRTTTVLLAETLCRKWHPSPCSSELWGRNTALACDLSPVTGTDEDSKPVYPSSWLCSRKKCVYRYMLLIPGKINMLRDDVLSMSVCHSQCQVLSSTCTTIQIYCDATSCRLVKSYRRLEGQSLSSLSAWFVQEECLDCSCSTVWPWRWRHHITSQRRYPLTSLHRVTYKTSIFTSTVMTASNLPSV